MRKLSAVTLTQRILGHCLIVSVVIAVTCTTLATQPAEQEEPQAIESEEIARIIANLPGWPTDRDLTKEEWRLYLMSAIAMQKTPPDTVREAMRTYKTFMERYREAWNIKPAILLRVMFDIRADFALSSYPYGVFPSGGIPGVSVDGRSPRRRKLVSPVRWTPEGPTLSAYMPTSFITTGGLIGSIPDLEYEYFQEHFKHREGLDDLIDVEISHWKDLPAILSAELTLRPEPPVPLGHGYTRRGEHIHFEGGSSTGAAGGTRIDKPSKANIKGFQGALGQPLTLCTSPDAASFEALSEEYCRDRNKVYYKWISPGRFLMIELPGADVASFRALSFVFAVDANSVWYMDQAIAGSDPASFVILDNRTGKDRNRVYVSGERVPHLDAASFRHLASGYFADKNGVYWGTDPVAGADLQTFEVLGDSFVAKDKDRAYRSGQVIDGFDAATTKLLLHDPYGYQFTSDRNGVYVNGLKFLHADPADFAMRDNRCGTGGRYLFFVDVWHSTPVTVYREDDGLVAETILYEGETKRSLAIVRADLTERGMQNVQLSPPPGAEATGTVPAWQMDIFQRPDLAKSLREKARSYLR